MKTVKMVGMVLALAFAGVAQGQVVAESQEYESVDTLKFPPLPLPLVEAKSVPPSGTFFSAQLVDSPPMPFCPFPGLPVYLMETTASGSPLLIYDDRAVDYEAIEAERQALRDLRVTAKSLGLEAEFLAEFGESAGLEWQDLNPPMMAMSYPSNSFWLEIVSVTNGASAEGIAELVLHGTQADDLYLLLSKEELTNAVWNAEQIVVGASGQDWTPTNVVVGLRTNTLYFMAVSLADSDGDGMPDWWEMENGFDMNDPSDGVTDADTDGYSNFDEYLFEQDPHTADPARPTINVSVTDSYAAEPSDYGVFTLTRTGDTSRDLPVYYTLSGQPRNGLDFQALIGEAVIAAGQSSVGIVVQPIDDPAYEGTEDLTLTLLPGLHYFNGTTTTGLVSIADDEIQPVKVWAWPDEVTENGGTPGVFQFSRSGDDRAPLTVNFTLTGTATNGVNYQTVPLAVTFAANASVTNVNILPVNDTNYFGNRLVQLTVSTNPSYFAETNCGAAAITIVEDDKPVVQVLADDDDAREASPVRNGRFKFTRTGATAGALEIPFAVHGTAIPEADYTQLPESVIIPSGSNFVYLSVIPTNDTLSEIRETVIVVLRNSADYTIGPSNSAKVFIDDNEPAAYDWELLTASSVNGSGLDLPAEFVIRRYGSTLGDATYDFTVTDQYGSAIIQPANLFLGDVDYNYSPFLPPESLRNWVTFNSRRSEARVQVHHPVSTWTPTGFYPLLNIYVSNLFGLSSDYKTVHFHSRERLIRAEFVTNQVTEGGTNILRLTRNVPQTWSPVETNTFSLTFTVAGLATSGVDHDLTSQSVTFPANVRTVDVPVVALTDSDSEGWESVYVRLNSLATDYRPDTRTGTNWMGAMNIGDPGLTNNVGPLDSDEDGMPDAWEKAYGLNPFVFNDPYSDQDGDGMPNLEESLNGTNPTTRDSDSDGVDDATEWEHGSDANDPGENVILAEDNYATVKIAAASCFKCHQTTVSAGNYSLTSVPPVRGETVDSTEREQIFKILKGVSYPIHVGGLVTADTNASYTAQITAPTNVIYPEFFLEDPDGMLGVQVPVSNLAAKVATLIVPKVELTWEPKGDNLPLDDYTNANGQVMGKRIFVGAKTPTDSEWRDTVLLKVKVTPPMPGSNIWVRAFDVDDTTDDVFDNQGIIDGNGRLGGDNLYSSTPGIPNGRLFVDSSDSSITTTQDVNGEAVLDFMAGAQPGNNYRAAATVFPISSLPLLQVGTVGNYYISAYTDKIVGGFNGGLSPLLTAWRKLHIELDSMTAIATSGPEANIWSGAILAVRTNSPNTGQSVVSLAPVNWTKANNELENGELNVDGGASVFRILGNEIRGSSSMFGGYAHALIVEGAVPTNALNKVCTVTDDDGQLLASNNIPTLLPMDGRHADICLGISLAYHPAFLEITDSSAEGYNPTKNIPFSLHEAPAGLGFVSVFDDAKNITDSSKYWCHTVTFGHEPPIAFDTDPDPEDNLSGATVKDVLGYSQGYSAVYCETIREGTWKLTALGATNLQENLRRKYWLDLYAIVAHEIGHGPGHQFESTDHDEEAIMQAGGPFIDVYQTGTSGPIILNKRFSPKSILRFRKPNSWTD